MMRRSTEYIFRSRRGLDGDESGLLSVGALPRRLVKTVHSRGESARRRERRVTATAEEEEHRQSIITGPPSACFTERPKPVRT